jgi:hypothetical protein
VIARVALREPDHPKREALSGRQDATIATFDTKIESMRFA